MPTTITRKTPRRKSPKKKTGPLEMGRVTTEALIENYDDLHDVHKGSLKPRDVRRVVVPDALADTGSTMLSLPSKLIKQLGLDKWGERVVTTTAGPHTMGLYGPVRLTIQGRFCTMDVIEVPNSVPVLIGLLRAIKESNPERLPAGEFLHRTSPEQLRALVGVEV